MANKLFGDAGSMEEVGSRIATKVIDKFMNYKKNINTTVNNLESVNPEASMKIISDSTKALLDYKKRLYKRLKLDERSQDEKCSERKVTEMLNYCLVVDADNKPLAPTKENKGWYLIRKGRAKLLSKYPMIIQLNKVIKDVDIDKSSMICGIDDGSAHVGIAIVQKCKTYNKVVFKGTIEQRQDVKKLMEMRLGYRRYHRQHKRYRPARFNNRASSKRKGRLAPSIKQKKEAILRVLYQLNKWINIQEYHLEDVAIDIRAMTDGHKLYKWQYQKSNRLDENLRKAAILRDNCKCQECGKSNCVLEVHHIRARRYGGADTISNLITLCSACHQKTEGKEKDFEEKYFKKLKTKPIRFDYAQHVMQGKKYLREKIVEIGLLYLTNGGETANKRIDWDIKNLIVMMQYA
jgi:RNase H-fold protein (predicted Holliday junction resolvase)